MAYVENGEIRAVVDSVFPLSDIKTAVQRLLDRAQFRKVVLTP